MWPWKPRRKPAMVSAAARHALGLKPEDQAHNAIADALGFQVLPNGAIGIKADNFYLNVPENSDPFIPEPMTPAELSPEYHAGLASRMIERLDADESRITDALETEQRQHDALMASLHAELSGIRKVRQAYLGVSDILTNTEPSPPETKPERLARAKRSARTPAVVVDHAEASGE